LRGGPIGEVPKAILENVGMGGDKAVWLLIGHLDLLLGVLFNVLNFENGRG
jgi:hypothetical protein